MQEVHFLDRKYRECTGVIHNHTCFSYDCQSSIDTVLKAAKSNRLDYLTINDHHSVPDQEAVVKALAELNKQGNYQPVVILGSELNDRNDHHHLLVFGQDVPEEGKDVEDYLELIKSRKGICFAAHPYERRATNRYPLYIWSKTKLLEQVDGLEIWNFSSSWLSKLNPKTNGILLLLFPLLYVCKPFRQSFLLWDELLKNGHRKAAIGSTDAHSTPYKLLFFTIRILSHKYLFSTIRTNVLLAENEPVNQDTILKALANGNSYIINYKLGYPLKFYAGIGNAEGKGVSFGEEIAWEKDLKFYYRLPSNASVSLVHNGQTVATQQKNCGYFEVKGEGYYRLHIERYGLGWIYTNNIFVVKKQTT